MATLAATASAVWPVCYNHLEKRADFKCFDCKYGKLFVCLHILNLLLVKGTDVFTVCFGSTLSHIKKSHVTDKNVLGTAKLMATYGIY